MTGVPLPIVPFLKTDEDGTHYLEQVLCNECNAVFFRQPIACPACLARDSLSVTRAPSKGMLRSYSIVYRSLPDVEVPFISAVVEFPNKGILKGTLRGVDPDPEKITLGATVETTFATAPRTDKDGNHYLTYFFQPC